MKGLILQFGNGKNVGNEEGGEERKQKERRHCVILGPQQFGQRWRLILNSDGRRGKTKDERTEERKREKNERDKRDQVVVVVQAQSTTDKADSSQMLIH